MQTEIRSHSCLEAAGLCLHKKFKQFSFGNTSTKTIRRLLISAMGSSGEFRKNNKFRRREVLGNSCDARALQTNAFDGIRGWICSFRKPTWSDVIRMLSDEMPTQKFGRCVELYKQLKPLNFHDMSLNQIFLKAVIVKERINLKIVFLRFFV